MTDATILIVMREITVLIYTHDFDTEALLVFSVLLLILGAIRLISIKYHPSGNADPFPLAEEKILSEGV